MAQLYTQKAFLRPYAVETMFCSIDEDWGSQLFKVDPAGHYYGYRGVASGVKEQEVVNHLEKRINKRTDKFAELSEKETIQESIKCLQSVLGEDFKATDIEVGLVSARNRKFRKLNQDEIKGHLNEIQEID